MRYVRICGASLPVLGGVKNMSVRAVLFDVQGAIYERPAVGVALQTLLDHYGLKPRHPSIVNSALRAAAFDANLGRIVLDDYYNALLRVHGLSEPQALSAGREALRFDAGRLNLTVGTASALRRLQGLVSIGALVNSPYSSADEKGWLSRLGVPPDIWAIYLCSCESGLLRPDPPLLESAIRQMEATADQTLAVSRDPEFLEVAVDLGMIPIALRPADPIRVARVTVEAVSDLLPIVASFDQPT